MRLSSAPSALRIAIRCLSGAVAPAIPRLQRAVVHASELAFPPAADPQRRSEYEIWKNKAILSMSFWLISER